MAISDRLAAAQAAMRPRQDVPKGWEPGRVRFEAGQAVEATLSIKPDATEVSWRDEIRRVTGQEVPEHREVVLTDVREWGDRETPNIYCKFVIRDREGASASNRLDLEEIVRLVKKAKPTKKPKTSEPRALVAVYADPQVGKVGSRGGTPELIERVIEKFDALDEYARQVRCESAYLIDAGDCVESFENTPGQAFTNDLSFPEQLRVARRLFTEACIRLAKNHEKVVAAGVPSNHAKWRRGKDTLGRPGDDFGIEIITDVADAFKLNPEAFGHVEFKVPDVWEESLALDIYGTILAVTHGHQVNKPDGIPQWWANQVHGGQPCADADILVTGHFHHLRVQPTGRSAHTGRSKWWIQAPTLDNGSDWFRHRSGSDSDPGLLVFTVDSSGWDNLKVL